MPEVICNTSPLRYLHQLGLLHILPALVERVTIPPAVVEELSQGRNLGHDVPDPVVLDWVVVRSPAESPEKALVTDLGPGESQVLALAREHPGSVVILDDNQGRQTAEAQGIPLTGTLGLLLDAKNAGLISEVKPFLEHLQTLRFRLASSTYAAVLKMAGETL